MKLIISRSAAADLDRLHAFLLERDHQAAAKAADELVASIDSLTHFPERGRPTGIPQVRELIIPFGNSSYVVRYAHASDADELIILRVWRGREERS